MLNMSLVRHSVTPVHFRTDGNVFNLRGFQSHTKTYLAVLRALSYADDCALIAHSLNDAQQLLFDRFHAAESVLGSQSI